MRTLAITIFLFSALIGFSANAAEQKFIEANYGLCQLEIASKKIDTVNREIICTVGPEGTSCVIKSGKHVVRTGNTKLVPWNTNGKRFLVFDDQINRVFLEMNKERSSIFTAKFLMKGQKGLLTCVGAWMPINQERFLYLLKQWLKNSGRLI